MPPFIPPTGPIHIVPELTIVNVTISGPNRLLVGGTTDLHATILWSDGSTTDGDSSVNWSAIGLTSPPGDLTGGHLSGGVLHTTYKVFATVPGRGSFGPYLVTFVAKLALVISPTSVSLALPAVSQLIATLVWSDGATQDITTDPAYTWASSDTSNVTVGTSPTNPGLLASVSSGASNVTITDGVLTSAIVVATVITVLSRRAQIFGPLMPDAAGNVALWGPTIPDYPLQTAIATGPSGVGTFELDLESGAKITMSWVTDLFKSYDGKEQRSDLLQMPKVTFDGDAVLIGSAARQVRSQLAKAAAQGQPFLLGLPYEEISVLGTINAGTRVQVPTTSLSDWAVIGQRVIVFHPSEIAAEAFVSGVGADYIDVSEDVSSVAIYGSRIMPAAPILLDSQQSFLRYSSEEDLETWQLKARQATFGFRTPLAPARLALQTTGHLAGLVLEVAGPPFGIGPGSPGNAYTLTISQGPGPGAVYGLVTTGTNMVFYFREDFTTTVTEFKFDMVFGGFALKGANATTTDTLDLDDVMALQHFSGGSDKFGGVMGLGATLATFQDRPVWDRFLQIDGTAGDSMISMTTLLDFDGVPIQIGQALVPDWGRALRCRSDRPADWQWLKLFLATARGRKRSFWIPTWRHDLQFVSGSSGLTSLVVAGPSPETGDFFNFWPTQRQNIQVVHLNGVVEYLQITGAVDNHDGTVSLAQVLPSTPASVALSASTGTLHNVTVTTVDKGAGQNALTFTVVGDALFGSDRIVNVGNDWTFHYVPGWTTVNTLIAMANGIFVIGGTWPTDRIGAGGIDEGQGPLSFTGGTDTAVGTISTSAVTMISWLELSRFESDDFDVQFDGPIFTMDAVARVVQQ